MNIENGLLIFGLFVIASLGFRWFISKPKTQGIREAPAATEPSESRRLNLAAGITKAKLISNYVKPHFSGTFGLCAAVLCLASFGLVYTYPGAIWYVIWLLPLLLVVTFLIIQASAIKSPVGRSAVIATIGIAFVLFVGPLLPGSTPAQPIQYTAGQMAELQEMRQACSGGKQAYTYLPTYQPVNPNGWCVTTFWHHGYCIYVRDAMRTEHGPYCDYQEGTQIRLPLDIREVRSGGSQFVGYLERKPDYKALSFYYSP